MTTAVSIANVLESVSAAFGFSVHELRSHRKDQPLADARQAAYLLALDLTEHGPVMIGRRIGGRDHSTVSKGSRVARARYADDEDYAVLVEAARQAALIVAASSLRNKLADADPLLAAERVCLNPSREATRVSTDEILAMAARLLDLEEAAGTTFQLLLKIDEIARLQPAYSAGDRGRWRELAPAIKAIAESLASQLAALGYHATEEDDDSDAAA